MVSTGPETSSGLALRLLQWSGKMNVQFYEAFEEEIEALQRHLPACAGTFHIQNDSGSGSRRTARRTHQHPHAIGHPAVVGGEGEGRRLANNRLRSSGRAPDSVRLSAAVLQPRGGGAGDPAGHGAVAEIAGANRAVSRVSSGRVDGKRVRREKAVGCRRRQHRRRNREESDRRWGCRCTASTSLRNMPPFPM
jgi:hypothetical protein